jgi:hypothetical protein
MSTPLGALGPVVNGQSNGHANGVNRAEVEAKSERAEDKGVPTHRFDPDASPQEKAAQAGKGREKLESVRPKEEVSRGMSIFYSICARCFPCCTLRPNVSGLSILHTTQT